MAFTYTKRLGSANKNSGATTTFALTTTGGASAAGATLMLAVANRSASVAVTGVTDAVGNAYVVGPAVGFGSVRVNLVHCHQALALPNGSTVTVAFASAQAFVAFLIEEFGGGGSTTNPDQTATGTGASANPLTASTATTAEADELLYAAVGVQVDTTGAAPTMTAGAGYTRTTEEVTAASTSRIGVYPEYRVVAATGAYTASGTLSAAKSWAAALATHRPSAGAVSARRPAPSVIA